VSPSGRDFAGGPRRWEDLDEASQTRLRVEYGRYLDGLPPTCSLEEKNARFARWLAERGVVFEPGSSPRSA
jgi:hypothetical protein